MHNYVFKMAVCLFYDNIKFYISGHDELVQMMLSFSTHCSTANQPVFFSFFKKSFKPGNLIWPMSTI